MGRSESCTSSKSLLYTKHTEQYVVTIANVQQIAGEAGKFEERIVDMLAKIGDVLPRFRRYEALFRNYERLLVALSSAFLDLLRF
jgi:hypothetical protein